MKIKNKKGLGLIEIMISFILFLFFVMAMNSLIIGRNKIYNKDKRTLIASNIAQKIIDTYKQRASSISGYLSLQRTNSDPQTSEDKQTIVNLISRAPFNITEIENEYRNAFIARVRICYGESYLDNSNVTPTSSIIKLKDNLKEIGLNDDNNTISSIPILIYQDNTSNSGKSYREMFDGDPKTNTSKEIGINTGSQLKNTYFKDESFVIGRDKMIVVDVYNYDPNKINLNQPLLPQILDSQKNILPVITASTNISFPGS